MTEFDDAAARAAADDTLEPAPLAISVPRCDPPGAGRAAVSAGRFGAEARHGEQAVMAVLSEAYASEVEQAVVDASPSSSAWARSQRGLREPLARGTGAWERFGR